MEEAEKPLIVVCNTSPITNLAAIGKLDLLRKLFTGLHIGQAVEDELFFGGKAWPGAQETSQASWIEVHQVRDRHTVDALRLDLDAGESETITLALQLQADLVLVDEQAGRRAARYLGLDVMGVVGLLLRSKQLGLLDEVRPLLRALRQEAGFYLSDGLTEHALRLSDEQ